LQEDAEARSLFADQSGCAVMRTAAYDLSTDEGLQAFIDSLPDEAGLRAELGEVLPQKRCAVCRILLPIGSRKDMRFCGAACKQAAYERRLKAAGRPYPRARSRPVDPGS
jgi:hypothetical protein